MLFLYSDAGSHFKHNKIPHKITYDLVYIQGWQLKGSFIFYEHGGAGGIWLIATTKLYDPPLACNFFPHGPPPQAETIFF